ncbi:hypothetical protein SAMN04515671_2930 [Nakamurella panacisegetis]|uniref:Uncharacterized protein n=1 Tax=Nakamurella panacisegetis TaxID=1090615 RepID=A0A1H0PX94_9ACTN|nr:hypothetical protein [Nakamurella panacisegetis]SDP09791.1 hypothetical protein SAMN04515671_2930 [Nakamurella panacisegetis]
MPVLPTIPAPDAPAAPMTTGAFLVEFRRELVAGGFSPAEAVELVAIACRELIHEEGLRVKTPE